MATLENPAGGLDEENRNGLAARTYAQQQPQVADAPAGSGKHATLHKWAGFADNGSGTLRPFVHNHPGL